MGETAGGIKVVLTSPRVAPGLLTRAAWQAFTEADEIGASADPSRAAAPSGSPASSGPSGVGASAGSSGAVGSGAGASAGSSGVGASAGPSRSDVQALVGSGLLVSEVKGTAADHWAWLSAAAASGRQVAWLTADDGEPDLLRLVADHLTRDPRPPYDVEILHGSYDVPGARLIDLVRVMDRLRRNCPWDQEQTHESLAKYLLEETYETLEAIDTGDRAHLREELGDLLLQVAFHSRIAEENPDEAYSIDDVAADIVEKLIRRHPHVFGTVDAADAAAVEANWETIKAAEKQRTSVLEGIPLALPALALADKVLGRAAKILPTDATPARPTDVADSAPGEDAERIGEELLALVREARTLGVDAEQALRATIQQLATEIRAAEDA